MYRLEIAKLVPNEDYEKEVEAFNRTGYNNLRQAEDFVNKTKEERHLTVTLTDEEYEAIKKAVLSTFK